MARKRYTAEEIIGQLRTIEEIELGNGLAEVEAHVSQVWRKTKPRIQPTKAATEARNSP